MRHFFFIKLHRTLCMITGGVLITTNLYSQKFDSEIIEIPIKGAYDGSASVNFTDIDNDGDFDIISTVFFSQCLNINTGNKTTPSYGKAETKPYNLTGLLTVSFFDADGDGDLDAIGGQIDRGSKGSIKTCVCFNTGTKTSPEFSKPTNCSFGLSDQVSDPRFVDIDGDGDLDMFGICTPASLNEPSKVVFQENKGSEANPDFDELTTDAFGLPEISTTIIDFADLDDDGDFDAYYYGRLNGSNEDSQYIQLNTGDRKNPSFAEPVSNITGLNKESRFIHFIDIDGDEYPDAVGTLRGKLCYQKGIF